MKKSIIIIILFFSFISCKSQQQIQPLQTPLNDIIPGAYVKDVNNELDVFVGQYNALYQGKSITFYITKEYSKFMHSTQKDYYKDVLIIKYIIKNSNNGVILQDTNSIPQTNNRIYSIRFNPNINSLVLSYTGTNCGIGNGLIFMKKISPTELSYTFHAETTVITDDICPPSLDKKIYLPEGDNIIFTKQ